MTLAIISAESNFNPNATSPVGAKGLMQIMPGTGRGLGVANSNALYDVATNIRAGVKYIKGLFNQFSDVAWANLGSVNPWARSDVKSAIAATNAGPGAVSKYGGVPLPRDPGLRRQVCRTTSVTPASSRPRSRPAAAPYSVTRRTETLRRAGTGSGRRTRRRSPGRPRRPTPGRTRIRLRGRSRRRRCGPSPRTGLGRPTRRCPPPRGVCPAAHVLHPGFGSGGAGRGCRPTSTGSGRRRRLRVLPDRDAQRDALSAS